MGINTNKGILLSGPVGCEKTSLMKLLPHLAPHKTNYEVIPTRNIVFNFNAAGYEILEKYNDNKNYCFDDLGVEPTGKHFGTDCNVMGEILLSRYDIFTRHSELDSESHQTNFRAKTHITTNFNAQELEERYGNRVRFRMRQLFNLVAFESNSKDKRK